MYKIKTYRIKLQIQEALGYAHNPQDVVNIAKALFEDLDADREHFLLLCANTKNRIYAFKHLFSGAQDRASIYIKETLRAALLLGASGIVLVHNHPSGDPAPSDEDRRLTSALARGCREIDLRILDHVILGEGGKWFSFAEAQLL